MKTCYMCGGEFEEQLTVCPICGTAQKVKLGLKPADTEADSSDTRTSETDTTSADSLSDDFYDRSMHQKEEKEISYAIEDPYINHVEVKKSEKEFYNSVDNRKYKNQIQVGYIMIYILVIVSVFSTLIVGSSMNDTLLSDDTYKTMLYISTIISALLFIIPTLFIQFFRSRVAAVILIIFCVLNLTSGFSTARILLLLGAIYCTIGVFKYKTKWEFYSK